VGRLFDTVAALTGFHRTMTFEGQAAIALEALARRAPAAQPYPWPFDGRTWDHGPLLLAIIDDLERGVERSLAARRFHETLAHGILDAALTLRRELEFEAVVVSGGVFQNALLMELVAERLGDADIPLWSNTHVPANDGGISLGQLALAATTPGGRRCA
jgi:hydrogenase maturation protein HypF